MIYLSEEINSNVETNTERSVKTPDKQIRLWHDEGLDVAAKWRRCEFRLVELLRNISRTRGYYLYHCESLSSFARHCWQLPENVVRDLVTVANKLIEVPEMLEALKSGQATVSKLRKICSVITREDQAEWIELVANCTSREVEKAVAMRNPATQVFEKMVYKSESLIELTIGISEELMHKIQRVQDLLAGKSRESATISESLEYIVDQALERLDPIEKAKRASKRAADRKAKSQSAKAPGTKSVSGRAPSAKDSSKRKNSKFAVKNSGADNLKDIERLSSIGSSKDDNSNKVEETAAVDNPCAPQQSCVTGRYGDINYSEFTPDAKGRVRLSAKTIHEVALRDQAQCTHQRADGSRCRNRRWLHIHHINEVAHGGGNELKNLATLCSGHHRMHHTNH
jgi:hypothetical protein